MVAPVIPMSGKELAEFCRARHIRRLAVFGSALRADFRPDSDLDLLVEFDRDQTPGLGFFRLQEDLSALMGRPVDLNTPACLGPHFRDEVLSMAEDLYVAS